MYSGLFNSLSLGIKVIRDVELLQGSCALGKEQYDFLMKGEQMVSPASISFILGTLAPTRLS